MYTDNPKDAMILLILLESEEVRDSTNIAYVAKRPVTGPASKGAEFFRRKAFAEGKIIHNNYHYQQKIQ